MEKINGIEVQRRAWRGDFRVAIEQLKGLTPIAVYQDESKFVITTKEGDFKFYHAQDCCETVQIEDVVGEISDLIGNPLLLAEEVSSENEPAPSKYTESFTWTFYKFATIKGYVDIRWLGESNGYYSESVDLMFIPNPDYKSV